MIKLKDELMQKAMIEMGWNPKSELPMANKENMVLFEELQRMTQHRAEIILEQEHTNQRCEKLKIHFKNAELNVNHNMQLLEAHQVEVRSEVHLFKLAAREHSKLKRNISITEKETKEYENHVKYVENEICKRRDSIDKMTSRVKWAKTTLEEWRAAMEDGDKGFKLIEKYFKDDQIRARQKDQRRQQLDTEISKKRKKLENWYDERVTLEQNLECIANLYRTCHHERRQMVETWKLAVSQMTQRESEILNGEKELAQLKEKAKVKDAERRKEDNKLTVLINNNREVEAEIDHLNAQTSDIKSEMQKIADLIILKENEVDLLQKDLQNLSNRVQHQRSENHSYEREKEKKLAELEAFELVMKKVEEREEQMKAKDMTAQQRLQMLEELIVVEEKALNDLQKENNRINSIMYRTLEQITTLKDEEKRLNLNNDSIRVTMISTKKNMRDTERKIWRQTEIHYDLAFKCLQLERRIITMQGGIIDPETEAKNLVILAQCEEQHGIVTRQLAATENQNKKLDDNMRKLTDFYNRDNKQLENLQFRVKEAQVYCEGGVKRLKNDTNNNQILVVELSILKMRTDEFEDEISKCDDTTFNLHKHRTHLNKTIKDRLVEIKSQTELLALKKKHMNEEKGTLRADIGERNKHIEAVRARFELTSKLLGTNEDGTLVTATQIKVESAQEKQFLLEEGNALNEKVIKAEQEIKAMENTLKLFTESNNEYRKSLRWGNKAGESELNELQVNYCIALSRLKTVRKRVFNAYLENERLVNERERFIENLEEIREQKPEHAEVNRKLQRDVREQKNKIQRAEREMKNARKTLRSRNIGADFFAIFERDLDLRDIEMRNVNALHQITELAAHEGGVLGSKIRKYLDRKGLKLPSEIALTRSSLTMHTTSTSYVTEEEESTSTSTSRSSLSNGSQLRSGRVSVISLDFTP